MKINTLLITCLFLVKSMGSQTLTTVTGKRLYEHHSSTLSSLPYGNAETNIQSGYDFVTHSYVASGTASLAASRDMLEHNGYYGFNGSTWGWKFGFTSGTSYLGFPNYTGNNQTVFYLNTAANYASLNTVSDLISAFNSTLSTKADTAVGIGDVYIVRVRNSNMYLAMRITSVSNLTANQVTALDNGQQFDADVYFDFEYKYGTLCIAPTVSASTSNSSICAGQTVTLTGMGAATYSWSNGKTTASQTVAPASTTTYVVSGSNGTCAATAQVVQNVKVCTGNSEQGFVSGTAIYPNPVHGQLFIDGIAGTEFIISNSLGATVMHEQIPVSGKSVLNTEQLPCGIYIVSLRSDDRMIRKKFIKD